MRFQAAALAALTAFSAVRAQPAPAADAAPAAQAALRETALDELLSERESADAHAKAIANARRAGVSEQTILEARFLYHVDRGEDRSIAAMLPEFLARKDSFKLDESAIFSVREDWLAVIEYVTAIDALGRGDKDGFKRHITEAFWLGPRQAAAFPPHIEHLRLEEAMRAVSFDFTMQLRSITADGATVTLADLIKDRKAMLLHFWSPRSQECVAAMPDFIASAGTLLSNGIAVVSLIAETDPAFVTDARNMLAPYAAKPCGAWLLDRQEDSLGRELRIVDLPAVVLVSMEGAILFNGDPTDGAFWSALKGIDARIVRPTAVDATDK